MKRLIEFLSGDNQETALEIAAQAGVEGVYAGLLPAQKVEIIQQLQREGPKVCMIGDPT